MKKLILLIAAVAMMAPAASFAQKITSTNISREKTYETSSVSVWYEGEVNVGYGLNGKVDGEDAKYGRPFVETVHGVRITKYAFVGAGVGFQYVTDDFWKAGMMPIFLNLKGYYPVSESFAPYVSVDLGYSAVLTSEADGLKGGMYASYGLGLNYKRLNFGFGMQHQNFKDFDKGINSFFVKVGLKF